MINSSPSIDTNEIEKFSQLAESWWDEQGKFRPLHQINPVRIGYILKCFSERFSNLSVEAPLRGLMAGSDVLSSHNTYIKPLNNIKLLDIGCGGGLLCEPMARLGADVTGIDASEKNIKIAGLHASQEGLEIDYRCISIEMLAWGKSGEHDSVMRGQESEPALSEVKRHPTEGLGNPSGDKELFDIILNMEVIEHVADVDSFMKASADLLKPGGIMFIATLNRTLKSLLMAKIGAEYILNWLPKGTHDWNKFLTPGEIESYLRKNGLKLENLKGMSYNPFKNEWSLSEDVSVNYLMCARKGVKGSRF